ncbi:MAG: methyltransferase family protein [Candidatus Hodarchaeales archaeon]|jgi:protein-S-isoprenylcysteine O-methyltransferase Ste14
MKLKGIQKFRQKLPGYSGKKIVLIPLIGLISFMLSFFFLLLAYWTPSFFPDNELFGLAEPILPIFGQIIVITSGFFLISRVWSQRQHLIKQSKELAYQRGVISGFIGVPFVLANAFHSVFPIALFWEPTNTTTALFFFSPFRYNLILSFILSLMGFILVLISWLTFRRAILTFGLDYMAVIYVYYPEESEIQDHHIYSVLRHPTYFAIILAALGGWMINFSVYSLISVLLVILGIFIHITFVEEKELLERFETFHEYKERVPAFIIKPSQILPFFRFILAR